MKEVIETKVALTKKFSAIPWGRDGGCKLRVVLEIHTLNFFSAFSGFRQDQYGEGQSEEEWDRFKERWQGMNREEKLQTIEERIKTISRKRDEKMNAMSDKEEIAYHDKLFRANDRIYRYRVDMSDAEKLEFVNKKPSNSNDSKNDKWLGKSEDEVLELVEKKINGGG